MEPGSIQTGSQHFANPVQEGGFYRERLITTFVVAAAIMVVEPLGPYRFHFAIGYIVAQIASTLAVRDRFESPSDSLGVLLVFDFTLKIIASLLMPAGWAPALVIAVYSVGVNVGFLTRRWLYAVAGLGLGGFSFTALLLRPVGAAPLLLIATILTVHAVTKRGSSVVSAERAYAEMRDLQIVATQSAADANWLASHDSLTGLSNRRALIERLDELSGTRQTAGLMLLDLDGFKAVNDDYGHRYGDLMLTEIASRLIAVIADHGAQLNCSAPVVARLGGDEFAVLCLGITMADLDRLAEHTIESLHRDAILDEIVIPVRVSVGLARASDCHTAGLLHHADIAMYEAKRNGGGIARFDPLISPTAMPGRRSVRPVIKTSVSSGNL